MIKMIIAGIVIFFIVDSFFDKRRHDKAIEKQVKKEEKARVDAMKSAGTEWENTVAGLKRSGEHSIRNLIIPTGDSMITTEIDMVEVTRKGIFVYECKHLKNAGNVYGKIDDLYWGEIRNPSKQNAYHIKNLKKVLGDNHTFWNVSVVNYVFNIFDDKTGAVTDCGKHEDFIEDYTFSNVEYGGNIIIAHNRDVVHRHTTKDVYTDKEVKEIYKKLLKYKGTAKQLKEHAKRQARLNADFR
ncbi:nuclease-related domain-containing protein [Lachnospira sp.]|jgi:hypothetical protein|uniref:nuclease-related domain-containing protein n=1 Tax=Lachnospira sp. TaxID=2049031 RepID=UPI00257FB62E|nr:nuclease-related domain-containing protein [Lachnospira sp.]